MLDELDHRKILDLKRVYGKGLADLLNMDKGIIDNAIDNDVEPNITKKIHSGVRLYWKAWMGKYREVK